MKEDASFGQWLMQRRHMLHVQRGELAGRVGCAVVTLRKIEADERRPSRHLAERLSDHLAIAPGKRERFVRAARGELPVDRLAICKPKRTPPTNLPAPTTALAGREHEIANVCGLMSRADVRLLTLTGAPGVGKTRVALEAAFGLQSTFADGVFFVDLAPLTKADLVPVAIAQAVHVGVSGGQSLGERLGRYLRTRRVLLVLDNFEHVLGAAPQLTQLLATAPQLKLLITSRVALEVSGERRFTLLPLGVPPGTDAADRPLAAGDAPARYAAIALFVERAQAVAPHFVLTEANVRAVSEICRRLDGLPLGIELAAAQVALFTPDEVLARLDGRFALLRSGGRDLPARHMTLWRALDWSNTLLSPTQQVLLRRLSVFADGCTVEEAQQVCNTDGAVGHDVVDGMVALLAASLLQRSEDDGRSRFTMLETVRAYAREQLHASGEVDALRQRHAAYYLHLAEAAEQVWDGSDEWAWLRRLVPVRPNLRAALRYALDAGDAAGALRLSGALFPFWTMCAALPEARGWLDAALALAHSSPVPGLAAVEAKVLNVVGHVAMEMSEYAEAYAYFERGLRLYRTLGDTRGSAWSLRGCAMVHMQRSEHAAAARLLGESLQLCQQSGDGWGKAWSLYVLASLRLVQQDVVQAQLALEDALGDFQQHGSMFGVFHTLLALAHTRFEQDDLAGAAARCRTALAIRRAAPLLTFLAVAVEELAMILAAQGTPRRAARLWAAAASLRDVTGEERWPLFQEAYDRALAAARMEIGEAEWTAEWTAGSALSAQEAVDEALADVEEYVYVGA